MSYPQLDIQTKRKYRNYWLISIMFKFLYFYFIFSGSHSYYTLEYCNLEINKMYETDQLNSFKYAQMQSSILNKTGASNGSSTGGKSNLVAKFSNL